MSVTHGHIKEVCQYGFTHSQCRCMSPNKMSVPVECNMPNKHREKMENGSPATKTAPATLPRFISVRMGKTSLDGWGVVDMEYDLMSGPVPTIIVEDLDGRTSRLLAKAMNNEEKS